MENGTLAVVFNEDRDHVLVIKRRDVPIWVLPGGGINPGGETPEESIIREVFEETGIRVEILRTVGIYTPVNRLTVQTHLFECRPIEGTFALGSETADVKFAAIDDLPSPFFYIHKDLIDDALSKEEKPLYRPFSNVTYMALGKYFLRHPIDVIRYGLSRLGFPINT
jgi:8-oxo-dGTP pyrophosphatase MutT (NUDIX family)